MKKLYMIENEKTLYTIDKNGDPTLIKEFDVHIEKPCILDDSLYLIVDFTKIVVFNKKEKARVLVNHNCRIATIGTDGRYAFFSDITGNVWKIKNNIVEKAVGLHHTVEYFTVLTKVNNKLYGGTNLGNLYKAVYGWPYNPMDPTNPIELLNWEKIDDYDGNEEYIDNMYSSGDYLYIVKPTTSMTAVNIYGEKKGFELINSREYAFKSPGNWCIYENAIVKVDEFLKVYILGHFIKKISAIFEY